MRADCKTPTASELCNVKNGFNLMIEPLLHQLAPNSEQFAPSPQTQYRSLLTRYSNRCQSAGCSFAKSIFLVALAFGNGASRSDRGLCPLRFGFASLAHIATYLSIGLIVPHCDGDLRGRPFRFFNGVCCSVGFDFRWLCLSFFCR
jgi:hypothetical protein